MFSSHRIALIVPPSHSKGYLIYRTGSTTTLHWFLVGSTSFLCLIGAGLLSKGVGFFQYYHFSKGVGGDVAETGDGPGSFQVAGNVWHLEYGNPEVSRTSVFYSKRSKTLSLWVYVLMVFYAAWFCYD